MRRLSNLAMACLGTVVMMTFSGASFAGDAVTVNVKNGQNIFENGKPDAGTAPCQSCHGEKALGIDAMRTPRLANIGYAYIVKQLTNFAEDKRIGAGVGAVMNGFAKSLTEQERRDVSAYVNSLPKATEPSDLAALKADGTKVGESYKGLIVVRYGDNGRMSACISCHGFNGRGADPVYPKIGQQKFNYLVDQLNNWREGAKTNKADTGSRTNDPMGQMRAVAKNLTDDDVINVATFLSQAPDSTPGDGMDIGNQTVLENIKKHH